MPKEETVQMFISDIEIQMLPPVAERLALLALALDGPNHSAMLVELRTLARIYLKALLHTAINRQGVEIKGGQNGT